MDIETDLRAWCGDSGHTTNDKPECLFCLAADEIAALKAQVQHYHDKAKGCEREMNRLRGLLQAHGLPLTPIVGRPSW